MSGLPSVHSAHYKMDLISATRSVQSTDLVLQSNMGFLSPKDEIIFILPTAASSLSCSKDFLISPYFPQAGAQIRWLAMMFSGLSCLQTSNGERPSPRVSGCHQGKEEVDYGKVVFPQHAVAVLHVCGWGSDRE